jgi:hypothetical protein
MGILDFLTDGQPIQAQPYARTQQAVLPDWYTNYAMDILSNQQSVASRPFELYQGPRIAQFTPDQQSAFEAARQGATSFQPELGAASAGAQGALGRSALGAAQPFLGQAAGMSGIEAAQPFLGAAGQTAPDVVGQYMNPYMENVVNRIGELGTRSLREQVLPGIEGEMIRAGQFGGTRQAEITGRAIRDAMEGISAQQSQALASGFGQAQQAAQTDLSRQAELARLSGGLTQQQQQVLSDIAGRTGSLYGVDTATQLGVSEQMARLAAQRQQQELTGAGALQGVGGAQQGQTQRNLDLAYQDFLAQQAYPQQQIGALTQTLTGVAPAIPKAELTQGYGSEDQKQQFGLSTLDKIIASGSGIGGLLSSFGIKI